MLEEEAEESEVQGEEGPVEVANPRLCLVGCFLTDRPIRVHMVKDNMAGFWYPGCGVSIKEAETRIFLFQFFHHLDIQKVLKQGPWHFDNHLLILGLLQEGQSPNEVPLYTVPFWIQVHNTLWVS